MKGIELGLRGMPWVSKWDSGCAEGAKLGLWDCRGHRSRAWGCKECERQVTGNKVIKARLKGMPKASKWGWEGTKGLKVGLRVVPTSSKRV